MKKIALPAIAVLVVAMLFGISALINKSAENIEETMENDSIFYFEKNTSLPDGVQVFAKEGETAPSSPAMWKATAADGNVLYLVGSIHALMPESYPLSSTVGAAFDECSAVAVEIENVNIADFLVEDEPEYPKTLDKGDTLKNHLTDDEYSALMDYLARHDIDSSRFENSTPWNAYNAFAYDYQEGVLSSEYGFDRLMQIQANIVEKEVMSVETLEAKYAYLPEMDERVVGMLIKLAATEGEDISGQYAQLWSAGEIEELTDLSMSDAGIPPEYKELWQQYLKYAIYDRNIIMADKAEEYLNSGQKVFMTVGSNHLVGDKGVVALLKAKGYTVERVE